MYKAGMPRYTTIAPPRHGTGRDAASSTKYVSPSGADEEAAVRNITRARAFRTGKHVRKFRIVIGLRVMLKNGVT